MSHEALARRPGRSRNGVLIAFRRWGLALGVCTALGCGNSEPGDAEPAEARPDPVEEILAEQRALAAAESGDPEHTLIIAVRRLPDSFDPLDALDAWGQRVVDDLLFQGLTRRETAAAPFASEALADRCIAEPPQAPRDIYCHLRPGTTFHDGTPVTTEDVLFSLEYWLDPRRGGLRARHGLTELRKIEVVDRPRTADAERDPRRWIRIGFSREQPLALELIAGMKIVPKEARRAHGRRFGAEPVGSGPMKLVSFDEDQIVLERVARDGTEDEVRRLILRAVPDGAVRLAQLRRGDVHLVAQLAPSHVPVELAKPGMAPRFDAYIVTPPHYDALVYNLRSGAQAGPLMRAALDDAIPREALSAFAGLPNVDVRAPVDILEPTPIDLWTLGEAGVSARMGMGGLPPEVKFDDAASAVRAATALDALGWPLSRGVRRRSTSSLRLALTWDGASGRPKSVATAIRTAWRELGIVVPYATASWNYVYGLMRKGNFEVGFVHLATRSDADLFEMFHSRGEHNISGVADAALDASLEDYRQAQDRAGRIAAKQRVHDRIAELKPMSLLHVPTQVLVASRRIRALEFVDDLPRLDTIRLGPQRSWIAGKL